MKKRLGSGIAALVAVNDGRASVAVGVTDDLAGQVSAVDLVKAAVAALGGQGGGGRPDMAQGGGPDGAKAQEALDSRQGRAGEGRGVIDPSSSDPVTLNGSCHCGAVKFSAELPKASPRRGAAPARSAGCAARLR